MDVLLLSGTPSRHHGAMNALRARGLAIRAASGPGRARRLLDAEPTIVLIDLSSCDWFTRRLVSALNHQRRRCLVVALYEGTLGGAIGEIADLRVDGFCTMHDWQPVASIAPPRGSAASVSIH